ncbi:MAG: hypothetical protein KJZ65_04050 [Phycisphaerales bacterium]|nr:hypothetical protein [Phycisphaerales bacterium]
MNRRHALCGATWRDGIPRLLRLLLCVCIATGAVGCRGGVRKPHPVPGVTAAQIVEAHNARVRSLDRLWARTSVQVTSKNEKGRRLRDQGDGHLQIVQPSSVLLSLGKLGQTQLYLGSNDQIYWWIDLMDSNDKIALVGRHSLVTSEKAGLLGVPVPPRDLIHLLGITTLPEQVAQQDITWDADARAGLETPTDSGSRRLWFDVSSMEPVAVELMDAHGRVVLTARLERYAPVNVVGDATLKPRAPEQANITYSDDGTRVKISLYAAENRPIRPTAFDFERLVKGLGVDTLYDLDAPSAITQQP